MLFAGHLHLFTILALCMGHFILVYSASPGDALFLIKKYHVKPVPKGQNNSEDALKNGYKTLILPVVIIIPFFIDAVFHESLVEARMGEAASDSASVLLTIIPSVGIALVVVLCRI